MIISCEKCNKKFELSDELVPDEGRLLQCGSCSHKWHYIPTKTIKLVKEIDQVSTSKKKSNITKDLPYKSASWKIAKAKASRK